MVFSSLIFLLFFLPVGYLLYCITKDKFKNAVLLVLSLIFYCWGEITYLWVIGLSFFVNYFCALAIDRKKEQPFTARLFLIIDLIVSIGLLGVFKYANFFIGLGNDLFGWGIMPLSLTLPLGISFFTFQILSYTIDVYRGKVKANKSCLEVALYVALFPQLIAGPIVRYEQVENELHTRKVTISMLEEGVKLFICGLAAKVLLANHFGIVWDEAGAYGFENLTAPMAWYGLLAFSLQIYFDFFGYSLMAIGLGKMFGFHFPKNFNYPYISKSITEFWRRWHMTLGTWFREYVYIPLGGNRKGKVRTFLNLLIVWALTGFWHGASLNFIFWGLYFFVFLMLEKWFLLKWLEKHSFIAHVYALLVIVFGWGIFAVTEISELTVYISSLFGANGFAVDTFLYYAGNHIPLFVVGILLQIPRISKGLYEVMNRHKVVGTVIMSGLMLVCLVCLVASAYNPFLYFRF